VFRGDDEGRFVIIAACCGVITARGEYRIGRFVAQKILAWQDIIENGKTLVVSWPAGSDHFVESWFLI
jgi:hypothetical protein